MNLDKKDKPNILVVDDTPENLRLLSQILSNKYRARLVTGGREALAAIRSNPPDLVLLDIMMPEMDGFTVAQQLKADPVTSQIPIIFISALDDLASKVKAFEVGGVDYVIKPFQESEVLARLETHLAIRNLQRELQAANARLAQQVEELAARNQELDAFAHTVAHDLKSPLGSVYLTNVILIENRASLAESEQIELLQSSTRVVEMMNRTLDGLMLLAGLRHEQVTPERIEMGALVQDALDCLRHTIQGSQAEIIKPDAWPDAIGYRPWIEEVWVNYITNAIKYGGKPPRLELGFDRPAPGPQAGMIRYWVRDNGPGLNAEQQAVLFTPFGRLKNPGIKGHGLGLSIVRRVIERLGGQVGVESSPGEGSLFYFTLPEP